MSIAGIVAAALMGVATSSASANEVWLWACHGPSGEAIPSAHERHSGTNMTVDPLAGGCDASAATAPSGWTLAAHSAPAANDSARVSLTLPGGLNATAAKINRAVRGFDGATGYTLTVNGKSFVTGNAGTPIAIDPANTVNLELSCSAPCTGTPAADIVSVALQVNDTTAPDGGVNRNTPVDKGMEILPNFMDSGVGLDYAVVSVDGYPQLTQQRKFGTAGEPACDELSPGNATNDRPLDAARCRNGLTTFLRLNPDYPDKSQVRLLTNPIVIDSLQLPEGIHKRNVSVYDAAGNRKDIIVGEEFEVWHPPAPISQRTLSISTSSVPEQPGTPGSPRDGSGGIKGAQRDQCRSPRLSVILRSKPVRVSKGVPVLKYKKKYRFTGRLTCVIDGKRRSAPKRTKLAIRNKVGKKTVRKPNTAIRSKGAVNVKLAFASSRTVIFRYANADGQKSEVKIKVRVTKKKTKK